MLVMKTVGEIINEVGWQALENESGPDFSQLDYSCSADQYFYTNLAAERCADFLSYVFETPYDSHSREVKSFVWELPELGVYINHPYYYVKEWGGCYEGKSFLSRCKAYACAIRIEHATGRSMQIFEENGGFVPRRITP